MEELLSVIVPIYNMEKYLEKCIDSIISQTYHNLEILLIDDGSTDSSFKICKKYELIDNRIKVYHKENGGLSDAKNYGIKKAIGRFITFVDADDWIDNNMYEVMMKKMYDKNADIAICGRYIDYENGKSSKWYYSKELEMTNEQSLIYLNSFYNFDMASWDKIYKTELFQNIEFPFRKKCEDAYTTYKLFAKSSKVIYIPECFYHYFQRKGSISRGSSLNLDYIYAAKEQMNFFKEFFPSICSVSETNFVFSVKAIFQMAIERKISLSEEYIKLKAECKSYSKSVFKNKYIGLKKKITFFMFQYLNFLYAILLKLKYAIKR